MLDQALQLVSVPKRDALDSFQLHAPLEVLARAALLEKVSESAYPAAADLLVAVGERYRESGPAATPLDDEVYADDAAALEALVAAIGDGDLDGVDPPARWLSANCRPIRFCGLLAPVVRDRLGGAAHGNIWLHLVRRVAAPSATVAASCRPLLRQLARENDQRLTWHLDNIDGAPDTTFEDVLASPPSSGPLESDFIHPTMDAVERTGLAAELLAGPISRTDVATGGRALCRIAALSMLQDDPAHAPYGWSHALTLAQGVLGASPDQGGLAVAATYVLGFRSAHGTIELHPGWPAPTATRRELADFAAQHEDAHLVKYTLACFDAADADPEAAGLFLSAARHLADWWRQQS